MLLILLSEGNFIQILQFLIFSIVVRMQFEGNMQMQGNKLGVGFSVVQIVKLKFWLVNNVYTCTHRLKACIKKPKKLR